MCSITEIERKASHKYFIIQNIEDGNREGWKDQKLDHNKKT
jgi:hypothetical protein